MGYIILIIVGCAAIVFIYSKVKNITFFEAMKQICIQFLECVLKRVENAEVLMQKGQIRLRNISIEMMTMIS